MCLDEMRLRLQQQINVIVAVQLGQFASLHWVLLGFQRHKRQPVCLLLHRMLRRVLNLMASMLLFLQTTIHRTQHSARHLHTLKQMHC